MEKHIKEFSQKLQELFEKVLEVFKKVLDYSSNTHSLKKNFSAATSFGKQK